MGFSIVIQFFQKLDFYLASLRSGSIDRSQVLQDMRSREEFITCPQPFACLQDSPRGLGRTTYCLSKYQSGRIRHWWRVQFGRAVAAMEHAWILR